jgi:hypothetical protein
MLINCRNKVDAMSILRNTGYIILLATSVSSIFALAAPAVTQSADAKSDYCKQATTDPACTNRYDQWYKCNDQAEKDGILTPREQEKCDAKFPG